MIKLTKVNKRANKFQFYKLETFLLGDAIDTSVILYLLFIEYQEG